MAKYNISQEKLKDLLHYDPKSGIFTWIKPLSNRVSKGDIAGRPNKQGYIDIGVKGSRYRAHRLAFIYMGETPPDYTDHIDGVRDNNAWSNLRPCTQSQNLQNSRFRSDNKSGIKGVFWRKNRNTWIVEINIGGRGKYFGSYRDIELAELVANEARAKYHGEFSNNGTYGEAA